ncbi:MAG: hypothetical protein HOJ35_06690, partial [Bdellovibrionales bacterium]|nr:hypothetical protein [Bdellovibrionales bacterium]
MKTKFLFIFVLCLITFNKSTNMISLANAEEVEDVDISIDDPRFSELRLEDQNLRLSSRIQDLEASNRIVNRSEIVRLNAKMDSNTETLVRERMTRDEESGGNYELNTGFTEDALGPAQHVLIIREAQINISCADPTNISSNLEIDVLAQQSGALYCSEERSTNNINDFCSCVSRSSANSDDGQYSPISSDNLQLMADLLVKKVIGDQAVNIRKLSDSIQRKYRWLNSNPQIYESQSDSLNNLSCISGGINSIIQEIATDESNRCNQSGLDFIADQFDIANKRFEENTPPGMSFRARAGEENESFGEYLDRIGSPQQAYENSGRLTPAYIDRDVLYRAARGTQFTRSAFNYGDDVNRLFSEYQSPLSEAQKAVKLEELISLLNEEENFRKLKRDPFLYSKFQQATQSCSLGCTPEQNKNGISSIVDFISVYATRNPGLNFSDAILGFETDQAAAFEVNECSELKNKFEKLCSDATTKDFKLTDYDIGRNPLGNPSLAQSLIEIGNASDSEEETIRNSTDQLMCSLTGNMTNTFDESGYTNFYSDPRIQHLLTKFESVDDFVAQATSIASDPERALQEAADYISSLEESSIFSEEFGLSDEDLAEIITDSNGSMQGTASSSASSDDADDTTSSSSSSASSSSTSSYLPTTTPTTPIPTSVPSATD